MARIFNRTSAYVPVLKLTDTRYRISYDFVPYPEDNSYGWWTTKDYFGLPANATLREDVINGTIARYEREGLTPPAREEIDVSEYHIEGAPEFDDGEISDSEALKIILGE
jgi:hypothetical protein